MGLLEQIADCVIRGKASKDSNYPPEMKGEPGVLELTKQALDGGTTPEDVLNQGLVAGMNVLVRKFRDCEIYLPDIMISEKAMKAGMDQVRPLLVAKGVQPVGTLIIGTVKGDMHDIGKNVVAMMVGGAGFEIVDLGVDVSREKFVAARKQHPGAVVGMSALLTTTMPGMKNIIEGLRAECGADVITIIGGAPVTEDFAREVGASAYAPDAGSAVLKIKELLGVSQAA
jgi:5-methyltetrahydrofolate--homocysteine methyltransferase